MYLAGSGHHQINRLTVHGFDVLQRARNGDRRRTEPVRASGNSHGPWAETKPKSWLPASFFWRDVLIKVCRRAIACRRPFRNAALQIEREAFVQGI